MPIIKEPRPLPSELSYVPKDTKPYRVTSSDTWWTLADRPEVRAKGLSANDLCYLNFKTRDPAQINWYLYHKVGCRKPTRDGTNYRFSAADAPGLVYLPVIGPPPKVTELPTAASDARLNVWIGVGVNAGTQFGPVGIETLIGYVFSLDEAGAGMAVTGSTTRLGMGAGVTAGASLVYITGVKSPQALNGYMDGGFGFNASLGGNWGKGAEAAGKAKKLQPLVNGLKRLGASTPSGLKKALQAHPDKWVEMIQTARSLKEVLGIDPNGDPNVFVFGWGVGVELSAFHEVKKFDAVWDCAD